MESSSLKIRSRRSSDCEVPVSRSAIDEAWPTYQSNTFSYGSVWCSEQERTSEGVATKSTEGSDWISLASSRILRTPGDFVLRGIVCEGHVGRSERVEIRWRGMAVSDGQ